MSKDKIFKRGTEHMGMFTKPKCKRCNEKISKKYVFCPHCGFSQKEDLGDQFFEPIFKLGFPFNKMFKELEKQIERQFHEIDSQMGEETMENPFAHGISINIDTVNGQPTIRINNPNKDKAKIKTSESGFKTNDKTLLPAMSEDKSEQFSKLPKEEPSTKVRRFNNKLVYEINLPGVTNENMFITKLENSIEIKAFSNDKAFFKLIPLSLPVIGSELKEGILNLELKI